MRGRLEIEGGGGGSNNIMVQLDEILSVGHCMIPFFLLLDIA